MKRHSQSRKQADRFEKFHRITSNRKSTLLTSRKIPSGKCSGEWTYAPCSNRSVMATWRTRITRIAIKIWRIDRIWDTSSNSVKIDERIWNFFWGKGEAFFFRSSPIAEACWPILSIEAKSCSTTVGLRLSSFAEGRSVVFLISAENSSRRVLM